MTDPSGPPARHRVRRAIGGLAVGLVLAEVIVRGVLALPAVYEPLSYRFGPRSALLAWYEHGQPLEDSVTAWHPRWGWTLAPGTHVTDGVAYTIDVGGHRVVGTPGDGPRVAVLGDSFTYGDEAAGDASWPGQLQAAHPTWQVQDLAVPGFGVVQAWLRWHDERPPADVVVVGLNALMVERTTEAFATWWRPALTPGACTLAGPIPTPRATWWTTLATPRLVDLGAFVAWTVDPPTWADQTAHAEATLACLTDAVATDGTPIVWVWLPGHSELGAGDERPGPRWFHAWCDRTGADCVDASPQVEAAAAQGSVRAGSHYNRAGSGAVAAAVGPRLEALLGVAGSAVTQ